MQSPFQRQTPPSRSRLLPDDSTTRNQLQQISTLTDENEKLKMSNLEREIEVDEWRFKYHQSLESANLESLTTARAYLFEDEEEDEEEETEELVEEEECTCQDDLTVANMTFLDKKAAGAAFTSAGSPDSLSSSLSFAYEDDSSISCLSCGSDHVKLDTSLEDLVTDGVCQADAANSALASPEEHQVVTLPQPIGACC